MTSIKVILLSLVLVALSQYRDKFEVFLTYSVDPMSDAFVKNNITAYVEFVIVSDPVAKADSVSFDWRGNIISRIAIDGIKSEEFFTYDSLNRMVHETYRSDIYGEICFDYDSDPVNKEVIKYAYHCNTGDTSLFAKEIIKYDYRLEKVVQLIEIRGDADTTLTSYVYERQGVKTASELRNGLEGFRTDYFYRGEKLIRIKRSLFPVVDIVDYVSEKTGLIDSTIRTEPEDTIVIYYEYYDR